MKVLNESSVTWASMKSEYVQQVEVEKQIEGFVKTVQSRLNEL